MRSKSGVPMLGKANPPRVYRAQKVVAKLEKEPRPALAGPGSVVTDPEQFVRDTLADYIGGRATEVFVVVFVNVRNQVIGYSEFSEGAVAGVTVNPSGIFREALVSGAAAIVTAHQHPTGDPTPSDDDRALWARLREAGTIIGVPVLDNLVIGEDGRFFAESDGYERKVRSALAAAERRGSK